MDFFHTSVSPRAIELVNETLQSTFLSEGRRVKEFELALESRLGIRHPVALNSGTSALHLALVLAGIGAGDEVILPAQTFVATGLAILMQRAVPVFADIDPLTGNITAAGIAAKISPRTRAVIPVHWAGYPCDLDEINSLAATHGFAVIEDAAHALGAATNRNRSARFPVSPHFLFKPSNISPPAMAARSAAWMNPTPNSPPPDAGLASTAPTASLQFSVSVSTTSPRSATNII